jgi:hypothetical protein
LGTVERIPSEEPETVLFDFLVVDVLAAVDLSLILLGRGSIVILLLLVIFQLLGSRSRPEKERTNLIHDVYYDGENNKVFKHILLVESLNRETKVEVRR